MFCALTRHKTMSASVLTRDLTTAVSFSAKPAANMNGQVYTRYIHFWFQWCTFETILSRNLSSEVSWFKSKVTQPQPYGQLVRQPALHHN